MPPRRVVVPLVAPNKQLQPTASGDARATPHVRHFIMHVRRASYGSAPRLNCGVRRHVTFDFSPMSDIVRDNVAELTNGDIVPLQIAQDLVRASAYWYGHPHGPAPAPRHAERLVHGARGWEITFGANTFLVEVALRRCLAEIERAADDYDLSGPRAEGEVRNALQLCVRGAVANQDGNEYRSYWDASDGYMHFGTQAIHVRSFVQQIWDTTEVYLIVDI